MVTVASAVLITIYVYTETGWVTREEEEGWIRRSWSPCPPSLWLFHVSSCASYCVWHHSAVLTLYSWREKSPIPLDRYDRTFFPSSPSPTHSSVSMGSPRLRSDSGRYHQLTAKVLYDFKAQHPRLVLQSTASWQTYTAKLYNNLFTVRELSAGCGDIITIIRRVDVNWYEAQTVRQRGIIPVTYVQVRHLYWHWYLRQTTMTSTHKWMLLSRSYERAVFLLLLWDPNCQK